MSDTKAVHPKMTQEHIEAFKRHALGWLTLSTEGAVDKMRLADILKRLESEVLGEQVVVSRAELKEVLNKVGRSNGEKITDVHRLLAAENMIERWLTPPSDESAER
jgi:hypothetical protein